MLVLSRKVGDEIIIGDNIRLVVSQMSGNRVSIAIDAPREVHVVRGELKGGSVADATAEDNLLAVI